MTALLLLALASGPGPSAQDPGQGLPSMHMIESASHPGTPDLGGVTGCSSGRALQAEVFGFLPYWTSSAWLQYDLISVLACFSIDMGPTGTITNWHGFPSAFSGPVSGIHSAGGKAVVTVVNFSSSQIHSILTTYRSTALQTMVNAVTSTDMDGVCIDFENVAAADRDSLTTFMEDLRTALDQQAPGSHLSLCTPAVDWSGAFDYDLLAETCDALFMMCYPFHGSWSTVAGPCCPLTGWGSTPESPANMVWTLGDYVIHAPEVHEKLVVGLPYYGFEWDTADQYPHSGVTGSCATLFYSTLAGRAETYGRLWDGESLTPWYAYYLENWNQGWFDDPESLGLKYSLILGSGLQGAGIWALGYDSSRPELWDCLEDWFVTPPPADDMTDNLEALFTLHGPSQYWHHHGTGQLWSHFYTYSVASGPDVNWAAWTFDLPDSTLSYHLEAWVPGLADAQAVYHISGSGWEDSVAVDQGAHAGQWVDLGGPWPASSGLTVTLGDRTGTSGQRLAFDCMRFTPASGVGGGVEPAPSLTLSTCPAPSYLIGTPAVEAGSRLVILDISGRVVDSFELPPGTPAEVEWPRGERPAGVYCAVLRCGGAFAARTLVLLP